MTQTVTRRGQPGPRANWAYRRRGFSNLLRMGHCAPTVMRTLLDVAPPDGVAAAEADWLVRLSAGMPGGIGNTGFECGAITSPLVMLGLRHGLHDMDRGLPVVVDKGHALCSRFLACEGTLACREIRRQDHFPRHCIPPILRSAELYLDARDDGRGAPIPADVRTGYARLYAHLVDQGFHCAGAVLGGLGYTRADDPEVFDAASAFMGGTLFMGRTCGAFTAGVMAIGHRAGEIEDSRRKVARMLAIMTVGGNAFGDDLNAFNASMNRGYALSKWFRGEFGSTQCRSITGCDFSDPAGVAAYVEGDGVTRCRAIASRVAEQVQAVHAEG